MNKEKTYQILISFRDGKWEAYYDYGVRQPVSLTETGETPQEAFDKLVKALSTGQ